MILITTCNACNNRKGTEKDETAYPTLGETGRPLEATAGALLMFIVISDKTMGGKGAQGRGSTSSGSTGGEIGKPFEKNGS